MDSISIISLDEEAAVAVLRMACESGITFYDTANVYRDSDKKIGHALMDAYRPELSWQTVLPKMRILPIMSARRHDHRGHGIQGDCGQDVAEGCHRILEDPHGERDIVYGM